MIIGKNVETGKSVKIDLKNLIKTRMILEANSGGGKSWAGRRIMEQTFGSVQHIIIDKEGEFNTLREKYDYLLVGPNGEIPVNIKSANLLAKKIMELKISTIIDLSELSKYEQSSFVKNFLDSLMGLKRELWSTCLIFVDECHDFCPEGKSGKAESKSSVINLMTKGRKRKFCGILMTQRISKLDKDASAEGNNKLSGRKILDIDRKRAGEELGFTTKEQVLNLRKCKDGEFYMFGPSISDDVIKVKVGPIFTTHEEEDGNIPKPLPTPNNIKKILKDVVNISKVAEKELKEINDYKKEVMVLRREIRVLQSSKPKPEVDERSLERARQQGVRETEVEWLKKSKEIYNTSKSIEKVLNNYKNHLRQIVTNSNKLLQIDTTHIIPKSVTLRISKDIRESVPIRTMVNTSMRKEVEASIALDKGSLQTFSEEDYKLKTGAIRMLKAIAMFGELTKTKVRTFSGISSKGTFGSYMSDLKVAGCIYEEDNLVKITEAGQDRVGEVPQIPTDTESLVNLWSKHIKSGAIRMLRIAIERHPNSISKTELQEESGISSKGTFGSYISDLRKNGLINVNGSDVTASEEMFE